MADQGKGSYVAFVGTDEFSGDALQSVCLDGKMILSFEEAVDLAEEQVRSGYGRKGVIEVVGLAVTRRAIVKRSVEVSVS